MQLPAQSLPRKVSAAEVVIIIGEEAVTYNGLMVDGTGFLRVTAIQRDITSLGRLTEDRRSTAKQSGTACDAIVPTIPIPERISGLMAIDIRAPDRVGYRAAADA